MFANADDFVKAQLLHAEWFSKTSSRLTTMYYRIKKGWLSAAKIHGARDDTLLRPLTPVSGLHGGYEDFQGRYLGICSVDELEQRFGVPQINQWTHGYYVRTEWAYERVKEVVMNETELEPKERLNVLQQMFIC